ncbi:hypothetical protein MKEN_00184400 [Mycena kentingensis (nom. inval.)]|nr:hypothetical protein MKEN_00184400 [Mycena kentingensis (nom. inval.)]
MLPNYTLPQRRPPAKSCAHCSHRWPSAPYFWDRVFPEMCLSCSQRANPLPGHYTLNLAAHPNRPAMLTRICSRCTNTFPNNANRWDRRLQACRQCSEEIRGERAEKRARAQATKDAEDERRRAKVTESRQGENIEFSGLLLPSDLRVVRWTPPTRQRDSETCSPFGARSTTFIPTPASPSGPLLLSHTHNPTPDLSSNAHRQATPPTRFPNGPSSADVSPDGHVTRAAFRRVRLILPPAPRPRPIIIPPHRTCQLCKEPRLIFNLSIVLNRHTDAEEERRLLNSDAPDKRGGFGRLALTVGMESNLGAMRETRLQYNQDKSFALLGILCLRKSALMMLPAHPDGRNNGEGNEEMVPDEEEDSEGVETVEVDEYDMVFGDGHEMADLDLPEDPALSANETRHLKNFDDALDDIRISRCVCCHEEGFHIKLKTATTCTRCHSDKGTIKKWSDENNVNPVHQSDLPACLKNLTEIEEMLIARVKPVMQVRWTRGRQLCYKDHIINFQQDIADVAHRLPRLPEEIDMVIIRKEGVELGQHVDLIVRREKVRDALLYKIANDPYYQSLGAPDENTLSQLPENGSVADRIPTCNEGTQVGSSAPTGPTEAASGEEEEGVARRPPSLPVPVSDTEDDLPTPAELYVPPHFPPVRRASFKSSTNLTASRPEGVEDGLGGRTLRSSESEVEIVEERCGHLKRHIPTHSGERNYPCTVPGCGTRCSRADNLHQHLKTHLPDYVPRKTIKKRVRKPRLPSPAPKPAAFDEAPSPCAWDDAASWSTQSSAEQSPPPTTPTTLEFSHAPILLAAPYPDGDQYAHSTGLGTDVCGAPTVAELQCAVTSGGFVPALGFVGDTGVGSTDAYSTSLQLDLELAHPMPRAATPPRCTLLDLGASQWESAAPLAAGPAPALTIDPHMLSLSQATVAPYHFEPGLVSAPGGVCERWYQWSDAPTSAPASAPTYPFTQNVANDAYVAAPAPASFPDPIPFGLDDATAYASTIALTQALNQGW